VRETAAPGRVDSYEGGRGTLAAKLRELGIRSEVGAPVVIEGYVWGALIAGTDEPEPLPPGTEDRLAAFAELIATRLLERDNPRRPHRVAVTPRAGIRRAPPARRARSPRRAQQHFVHAIMNLQLAHARRGGDARLDELVDEGLTSARTGLDELRELARGIHPPILTHHGLAAAVASLADRAPVPVEIAIPGDRYPPSVESAAYFVAAEALTNVAKYAQATHGPRRSRPRRRAATDHGHRQRRWGRAFTAAALNTVEDRVRPAVAAAAAHHTTVEVGGNTSAYADFRIAMAKDQKLIFPVAALLVAVILAVLLRSLIVPLIVMAGVTVGFLATLGASVLAFQGVGGHDG
jgi:hypothetical protein